MSAPLHANDTSDDWLTPLRFGGLLGLLILVAFPQVIFGLQTFVARDFGYFGYPLANYFRESFWRGEIPLWNPLNDCGIPFLAQWNTQVLYPPALFYLLLPLSWSLGVFCLLHLWLGGMGMFFLARRWTGNNFAAAVAGIAFAFNGLMLNSVLWPATIPGLGWMPWVVWLVERAWRDGGKSLVVAGIVGALQMLSGAAEVIMLTWGLLAVIAVGEIFSGFGHRQSAIGDAEMPIADSQWPIANRNIILRLGTVVLLITGLCAAQLLPFFELLQNSNRQENFNAAQWAMPVTGFGNFLAPLFRCENPYGGVFLQHNQYWTTSYYVGITTIALALVAFSRQGNWRVWLLGVVVVLGLLLALGDATPIYKWATRAISVLSVMRFPVKFVILPAFILPLLAAFAVAKFSALETGRDKSEKTFWLISLCLLAALGAIVWLAWKSPRPQENWPATWHNAAVRGAFFIATIFVLVFSRKISTPKLRILCQLLLLLLIWLDLFTHMPFSQTINPRVYSLKLSRGVAAPAHGNSRAMITQQARSTLATSGVIDPQEDYLRRRWALFSDCNLLEGIPKVDGFFPLYPREHMDIFRLLFAGTSHPGAGLLDFVGVSMITSATNVLAWDSRTTFLPMLTGGQKPIFTDSKETLRSLAATNFNPRAEVFLLKQAAMEISATNASNVAIRPKKISAHSIEAEVETTAPAMIVAAQTFYPAWKAFVDGKPVRLWRANHAFQAIEVPAGTHQVKLAYRDRKFYLGAAASLATLAICGICLFRKRRGRNSLPSP